MRRMPGGVLGLLLAVGALAIGLRAPAAVTHPAAVGGEAPGTATPAAAAAAAAHENTVTVAVGGTARTALVVRPATPSGVLLLVLPGFTETVEQARAASGADTLTGSGLTVAYLHGVRDSWNAGFCCGDAVGRRVDDVTAIRRLAAAVAAADGLDPRRVLVAGHSNGAFMAIRLACETHGTYAGYVSFAGALVAPSCASPDTAPMYFYQGARDTVVPVAGRVIVPKPLPPLTSTLATFTAGCLSTGTDWRCGDGRSVHLDLDPTGTHAWPAPLGAVLRAAITYLGPVPARDGV